MDIAAANLLNISANFILSSLHEFGSSRTAFVANQMRLVRDQVSRDLFCQCPLGMNSAASCPPFSPRVFADC
jgi:hypothetical protein